MKFSNIFFCVVIQHGLTVGQRKSGWLVIGLAKQKKEVGICSWYGADGEIPHGWPTASGEGFDRSAMAAAHKSLPFGTRIRVRNLSNKKTVDVKINDRGPYTKGRILDLTFAAFEKIESRAKGITNCTYTIIK